MALLTFLNNKDASPFSMKLIIEKVFHAYRKLKIFISLRLWTKFSRLVYGMLCHRKTCTFL